MSDGRGGSHVVSRLRCYRAVWGGWSHVLARLRCYRTLYNFFKAQVMLMNFQFTEIIFMLFGEGRGNGEGGYFSFWVKRKVRKIRRPSSEMQRADGSILAQAEWVFMSLWSDAFSVTKANLTHPVANIGSSRVRF